MNNRYEELEAALGYSFKDKSKLDIAFTHKSFSNEKKINPIENYERFEFLGDAVLELLVTKFLFENYPDKSEGELTKLRTSLVCEFTLSKIARDLQYGKYGFWGKGELLTGGNNRDSILCDMFESVLGAIYLDGGIEEADKYVRKFLLTDIEHKRLFYDAKTSLQEYVQSRNETLKYILVDEIGPQHDKEFFVEALIDDVCVSKGNGHSKKSAEQMAAYNALKKLTDNNG